jgi:hypothetical protein
VSRHDRTRGHRAPLIALAPPAAGLTEVRLLLPECRTDSPGSPCLARPQSSSRQHGVAERAVLEASEGTGPASRGLPNRRSPHTTGPLNHHHQRYILNMIAHTGSAIGEIRSKITHIGRVSRDAAFCGNACGIRRGNRIGR